MTNLREVQLGDAARSYILKRLHDGNILSQYLHDVVRDTAGKTTTFAPVNVSDDVLYDFDGPGISSSNVLDHGIELTDSSGSAWRAYRVPTMRDSLIDQLSDDFQHYADDICLFEDMLASRNCRDDADHAGTRYYEEIYRLVDNTLGNQSILRAVELAWNPFTVAAISPSRALASYSTGKLIAKHELLSVAQQANKVIIVAYDVEGFLIWHRSQIWAKRALSFVFWESGGAANALQVYGKAISMSCAHLPTVVYRGGCSGDVRINTGAPPRKWVSYHPRLKMS